jgi:thiamine pyrophosphokinase
VSQTRAVIIADGDPDPAAVARALAVPEGTRRLIVAADGGARHTQAAGATPDLVVGDGDSLGGDEIARLRAAGVEVQVVPVAKNESDTELAVLAAIERGASSIRITGVMGGPRVEHEVANLLLLAHPALDGVDAAILAGRSTIRRIGTADGPGSIDLTGRPGDYISLLPIDTVVEDVRTQGLRYPLHTEPLRPGPARGLSNEFDHESARVTTSRGRLLVIQTPRDPSHKEAQP